MVEEGVVSRAKTIYERKICDEALKLHGLAAQVEAESVSTNDSNKVQLCLTFYLKCGSVEQPMRERSVHTTTSGW